MKPREDPSLSASVPTFIRPRVMASDLRSLPSATRRAYRHAPVTAGFVDDLRVSAPPLIVDATPGAAKSDALVPSLASWNPRWRYPTSGVAWWTMTPAPRAFYDYIASSYAVVDVVGPQRWVIYARRTGTEMR